MANEFIARKGLIALDDTQITGSLGVSGSLELKGSGSTLFNIVGSEGTLFSITDSLSGSLFAVSDVSGLPILEVFSDDTVKIGSFNDEAITVSGSHTTIGGVLAIPGFTNVSASLAAATAGGAITASDVSASGTGYFNAIRMPQDDGSGTQKLYFGSAPNEDNGYLYDDGDNLRLGYNDSDILSIHNVTPHVSVTGNLQVFGGGGGNITASGDISASGTFISNGVTVDATGFGASDNALQVVNSSGTPIFEVEGTGDVTANQSGRVAAFNIVRVAAGAQSAPSIAFSSDTNTGIYAPSSDQLNIQAGGGTVELYVNTSGVTVNNGTFAIPGFSDVSASLAAAASGGGGSAYHTWIGGKGQNTSQSTFGTQWRGGMSGNAIGGSFVVNADTSLLTVSSGTPSVGDTISANNYKIITTLIHPAMNFTTIDWYGHLRAYNAACDGNEQHMEIWTLDDVDDLAGFGTTTLTFRGGNQWTYDSTSATIKPIITSGSISHTGTETTAFVVVSHVPTNPASSMQFVYKFDFTVT